MIILDGSQGEGGGQILRSALSLSLVTGRAFRVTGIRARRPRPGLMRQHLACVEAAARVGSAQTGGAALGSTELTFEPGPSAPGCYEFRIGSAGSTTLLFQTLLPPLMLLNQSSEVILEGGTHNPFAPPFPFLAETFLPVLAQMGLRVSAFLDRAGFYPNGGGRCRFQILPASNLRRVSIPDMKSGAGHLDLSATAVIAGVSRSVAARQLEAVRGRLLIPTERCRIDECPGSIGPGSTLHVRVPRAHFTEVITAFGGPGSRPEDLAASVVDPVRELLGDGTPVGPHLADQLLLPMALARGGTFVTTAPTEHFRTQTRILRAFLGNEIILEPGSAGRWHVIVEERK